MKKFLPLLLFLFVICSCQKSHREISYFDLGDTRDYISSHLNMIEHGEVKSGNNFISVENIKYNGFEFNAIMYTFDEKGKCSSINAILPYYGNLARQKLTKIYGEPKKESDLYMTTYTFNEKPKVTLMMSLVDVLIISNNENP